MDLSVDVCLDTYWSPCRLIPNPNHPRWPQILELNAFLLDRFEKGRISHVRNRIDLRSYGWLTDHVHYKLRQHYPHPNLHLKKMVEIKNSY